MRKLTVGSCFSGIGGLEIGLEWTGGFETKWQIENDAYATTVLAKHWNNVKRYGDIRSVDPSDLEPVDLICGGYPCQPFSHAGERKGSEDKRHLWPFMHRLIRSLRPRFALMENVTGHLSMGFDTVLRDLAECGYDAEWQVFCASDVGLPHRRERVFIIAYPNLQHGQARLGDFVDWSREVFDAGYQERHAVRIQASDHLVGMDDGVRGRAYRLRGGALGNAVSPKVAQKVGEMILRYEAIPTPTREGTK